MTESSLTSRAAAGAAALWNAAARVRIGLYRRGLLPKRRLNAKVISIGNIAWGGTGKTPFTIWLARRLADSGLRLSILTRGHRRTSRAVAARVPDRRFGSITTRARMLPRARLVNAHRALWSAACLRIVLGRGFDL